MYRETRRAATVVAAAALCTLLPVVDSQVFQVQNCSLLSSTAYDKYSASEAVERNSPSETMPLNAPLTDSKWQAYIQQAALPSIIIGCIFLCLCCALCCWNMCCMNRRLDEPGTCVPSEKWGEVGSPFRQAAWGLMVLLVLATAAFTALGIIGNSAETTAVKGVPSVLSTYAEFLGVDVGNALVCLSNKTAEITATANNLQNCNAAGAVARDAIAIAAQQITDVIGTRTSGDGAVDVVISTSDSIDKMSNNIKKGNDDYAAMSELVILVIILALALCIVCNMALGATMGFKRSTNNLYCSLCMLSECMVNVMFPLLIIACILLFVLRFSAGFCSDPFPLISRAMGSKDNATQTTYYLKCSALSEAQRVAEWPWTGDQANVAAAYNIMEQNVAGINLLCADPARNAALVAAITQLRPECVGDGSVLGVNGVMTCGTIDRLLQAAMIKVCKDVFDPLDLIFISLIGFATVVVCLNCVNHHLRRESETNVVFRKGPTVAEFTAAFSQPKASSLRSNASGSNTMPPSRSVHSREPASTTSKPAVVNPVFSSHVEPPTESPPPAAAPAPPRRTSTTSQSGPPEPPTISREMAQEILVGRGTRDGDYVIRRSNNLPGGYVITCAHKGLFFNEVLRRDGAVLMYQNYALGAHFSEALESLRTEVKLEPQGCPTAGGFHIISIGGSLEAKVGPDATPASDAVLPGQQLAVDEDEFERERKRKALERQQARASMTPLPEPTKPTDDGLAEADDPPPYDVVDLPRNEAGEVEVPMCKIVGYTPEDVGTELLMKALTQQHGHPIMGVIRFVGVVTGIESQEGQPKLGVELKEAVGKHDGCIEHNHTRFRFFKCAPGYGLLTHPQKVAKLSTSDADYEYEEESNEDGPKKPPEIFA